MQQYRSFRHWFLILFSVLGLSKTVIAETSLSLQELIVIPELTSKQITDVICFIEKRTTYERQARVALLTGAALTGAGVTYAYVSWYKSDAVATPGQPAAATLPFFLPLQRTDRSFGQEVLHGIRDGCIVGFYSAIAGIIYLVGKNGYKSLEKICVQSFADSHDKELAHYQEESLNYLDLTIMLIEASTHTSESVLDACFAYAQFITHLATLIGFCQYHVQEKAHWGEPDSLLYSSQTTRLTTYIQQQCNELLQLYDKKLLTQSVDCGQTLLAPLKSLRLCITKGVARYKRIYRGFDAS